MAEAVGLALVYEERKFVSSLYYQEYSDEKCRKHYRGLLEEFLISIPGEKY